MKKVFLFSVLLIAGLIASQFKSQWIPTEFISSSEKTIEFFTMLFLGFIMVHVGYEFEIDKKKWNRYLVDFGVATTAAAIPWILCSIYFALFLFPVAERFSFLTWKKSLLAGCFSAATSAGILFSMLAAGGLSGSWVFKKARVLAIFDDIATILFLVPLKMMIVGFHWQLAIIAIILIALISISWRYLHSISWPVTWPWVMLYSLQILALSEAIYIVSQRFDPSAPIRIEILLPAFVLGSLIARPRTARLHSDDTVEGHLEEPGTANEQKVSTIISAGFMFLVGLSMPEIIHSMGNTETLSISWREMAIHVLAITFLANLGKMFPFLCYRDEAVSKERLALCIGMWPRGEVGAGVLVIALSYGFGGPMVTVATLSLALNLICTGLFIVAVKRLIRDLPKQA